MPRVETRQRAGGAVRYVVRFRHPDPPLGRSGYTSATFATEAEAERFVRDCDDRGVAWALAEYKREKDDSGITVDEWASKHFDSLTAPSRSTVQRYRTIYRSTWADALGHLPLAQVTRSHVAAALNKVEGADKTRHNKWVVLVHIFSTAVLEGLIPKSPCVGVKLGRRGDHERGETRFLTIEEFSRILTATPVQWRPLVMFMGGTGVRWGEAVALDVRDVDLGAAVVRVTKAEKADPDNPGQTIIGPTKTAKSRRTITLPPTLVSELEPLMEGRKGTARLFVDPEGRSVKHRNFYDLWLKTILPAAGVDRVRLHDLRHSHVAWLIADRVPLPVIQARLGHEKITTTIDTYGHLLPDLQIAAVEAAQNVFRGLELPPRALAR